MSEQTENHLRYLPLHSYFLCLIHISQTVFVTLILVNWKISHDLSISYSICISYFLFQTILVFSCGTSLRRTWGTSRTLWCKPHPFGSSPSSTANSSCSFPSSLSQLMPSGKVGAGPQLSFISETIHPSGTKFIKFDPWMEIRR